MTRTIIKGSLWVLSFDKNVDAPADFYSMECASCAESSWAPEDETPVAMWAIEHARLNPHHTAFIHASQRSVRAHHRRAIQPDATAEESSASTLITEPLNQWRPPGTAIIRSLIAYLGRFAGPLLMIFLVTGGVALGLLIQVPVET